MDGTSEGPPRQRNVIRLAAAPVVIQASALLSLSLAGPGAAQVRCPTCRVDLDTVVMLDDRDERVTFSDEVYLIAGNGRYLVVGDTRGEPGRVLVFDLRGEVLAAFGRVGEGPGELRFPRFGLLATNDSLWVLDTRNARVSIYGEGDWTLGRSFKLPFVMTDAALVGDTLLLAAANLRDEELIGYPLHAIGRDGAYLGPWGTASSEAVSPNSPYESRRLLSVDDGIVVASTMTDLSATVFEGGPSQARTLRFERPEWYAYTPPMGDEVPWEDRPDSFIEGVHVDASNGLVWLLLQTADANWQRRAAPTGEMRGGQDRMDEWYDTVISAFDLTTGVQIVERRLDLAHRGFYGPYLTRFELGPGGAPRLFVLGVSVTR